MSARRPQITRLPDQFNTDPNAPTFAELALPLVRRLLAKMAAEKAADEQAKEAEDPGV